MKTILQALVVALFIGALVDSDNVADQEHETLHELSKVPPTFPRDTVTASQSALE